MNAPAEVSRVDVLSQLRTTYCPPWCLEAVAELIDCVGDAQSLLAEIDNAVRTEHKRNGAPQSKSVAGIINERLTAALRRLTAEQEAK